jgi:hypothetical protein
VDHNGLPVPNDIQLAAKHNTTTPLRATHSERKRQAQKI